jgi:surface protein
MFFGASKFNRPIGNWDVSKVTNMPFMFCDASKFNHPIGNWDVSKVTNMGFMFSGASKFNHPIGNWDVSKVTDMGFMFSEASEFKQPICMWNTNKVIRPCIYVEKIIKTYKMNVMNETINVLKKTIVMDDNICDVLDYLINDRDITKYERDTLVYV